MIKNYVSNINELLESGKVEGIKLNNIDLLKKLFNDSDINNKIFKKFYEYFTNNFEYDDLYMKCEDLVYNINLFVNEFLIKTKNINDYDEIKENIDYVIDEDIDLYCSPNYNEFDKEVIEEYKEYYGEELKI